MTEFEYDRPYVPGGFKALPRAALEDLYICATCGAVVLEDTAQRHDHWHDTLTDDYREHPEDY